MNPIPLDTLLANNEPQQLETSEFIPNLLPIGLTLLYGPHHSGKSLLSLHLALSIALGEPALGNLPTNVTGVLYLGLGDTPQRMYARTRKLLANRRAPANFTWTNTLTSSSGTDPIAVLDLWLSDHKDTRLVIIDSLQQLKPTSPLTLSQEYALLHELKTLADRRRIAILVTYQLTPKTIRSFPDTQPATASLADTILILKRTYGQPDATLYIVGNNLPYQELALQLPTDTLCWTLIGPAADHRLSQERQDILALLEEHHSVPLTPKEIAALLHKDPRAITKLLFDMSHANQIRVISRGKYTTLKPDTPPNRFTFFGNNSNVWNISNNHNTGNVGEQGTNPPNEA